MQKFLFPIALSLLFVACKTETKNDKTAIQDVRSTSNIKYSKSFTINQLDNYKTITITNPWPGSDTQFTYALVEKGVSIPSSESFDAVIEIPIKNIVVTSTTHIPSLEMLQVSETLVGFPNLDYISSEATRKRINNGEITELGRNEDINTEVLIDLAPDLVVGFAVDGNNTTFSTIEKTGIPVVYNADWTETSPLGKAEWIKFFGALYNKEKQADSIFTTIEAEYLAAKEIASKATQKPTVLSGSMYKDVWYLPQGDSWAAQFIADANGDYLWKDSKGSGSISLNLESVLEKGIDAEYWIGPGQFTSLSQIKDSHEIYSEFRAFKTRNIYSSTNKKGITGGVLYYELAPNRPDLVLKDIVKILHAKLLPEHELFFFSKLD